MRNIKALFDVLRKNAEMKVPKKGTKGSMYLSIGIIALSCIMIPCCVIVGFVSYIMTLALIEAGAPECGIMAEIHIMSAFSLIFGMLVIFNILFFSSDREHLMPLPFKGYEILMAKFFYAYMAESVMEFMVLISMFIGFFMAYGVSVTGIISAMVGVIIIPLMPMAYCAIIGLVLLCLLRGIKDGRIFGHVSTICLFLFVVLFMFSFRGMGGITVDNYVNSLSSGNNLFSNVLNKVFFATPSLLRAVAGQSGPLNSILNLVLSVFLNIVVVAIMGIIGSFTYTKSLLVVGALGSKKKKKTETDKYIKKRSIFLSYFIKEWKVLIRTKAYSGNCVFINLLWPALIIIYYIANRKDGTIDAIASYFEQNYTGAYVLLSIGIVLLSFIASAMNSLASTSLTREGRHIDIIKYIPVPYRTQALVKALISVILTLPGLFMCDVILCVILSLNGLWMAYYAVIIIFSVLITTVLGMYLDSSHPHITWDDEYSALRGNLNTFFDMALVMFVAGIICGLGFVLNYFGILDIKLFHIYMLTIVAVLGVLATVYGIKKIPENMDSL